MNWLKNKEICCLILSFGIVTVAGTVIGAFTAGYVSLLVFAVGAFCCGNGISYAIKREKELAELDRRVVEVLYYPRPIIGRAKEGELYKLENDISKLTIRLSEQTALLEAEKKALQETLSDISHQIRTPLTAANLNMTMLMKKSATEEKQMELLRKLGGYLEHIERLVEVLLKTAKLDAGTVRLKRKAVSCQELIRRAAEPFLIAIEVKEITFAIEGEDGLFWGDIEWSTEAIGNLIKNAVEHTPVGGTIEVEVQKTNLYCRIVVFDSGEPIGETDMPHLFERFYRGKNASPASIGIGLAFAAQVIKAQNGTIRAFNPQEGGAAFEVRFYSVEEGNK